MKHAETAATMSMAYSKCEIQTFDIANIPALNSARKYMIQKPPLDKSNKCISQPYKGSRSSIEDVGSLSILNKS